MSNTGFTGGQVFRIVIIGGIFKFLHVSLAYIIRCTQGEGYSFMRYAVTRFVSDEVDKIHLLYLIVATVREDRILLWCYFFVLSIYVYY